MAEMDAEPKRESRRSVNDYRFLRRMKPLMEMVRDAIGSTKVIKVPSSRYESTDTDSSRQRLVSSSQDPSMMDLFGVSSTPPPNSPSVPHPPRGSRSLSQLRMVGSNSRLDRHQRGSSNLRRDRGSIMSTTSVASHLTEYSFVKDTANGASATIFKTYQDGRFQCVAVKRIRGRIFEGHEEELQQMLNREKVALTELSECPYITKFYEYVDYTPLQEHWMVMEFCDGGSAIELLRRRLPLKQIAAIVGAVLRAIEFIHDRGYIHGDIKCANILLSSPGVVKVCDFGLASKVRNVERPDFHALGTVDYMAPEVMLRSLAIDNDDPYAEYYMYDRKIDIWAVGIVVLELLIGHPPLHYYRRYDEDSFSIFIAEIPRNNSRQTGLFDLFYPDEKVHREVADYARSQGRNPPDIDINRLVRRFPELRDLMRREKLQELLRQMSLFPTKPDPANQTKLFAFNPASVIGIDNVQRMYALNKCLSFVSQCLLFDRAWRPEAKDVGLHPFVKTQYKEYIRLEPEINEILKQNKSRAGRKHLWKEYPSGTTIHEINKIIKEKENRLKQHLRQPNGGRRR